VGGWVGEFGGANHAMVACRIIQSMMELFKGLMFSHESSEAVGTGSSGIMFMPEPCKSSDDLSRLGTSYCYLRMLIRLI
jgi:hypothetical protein